MKGIADKKVNVELTCYELTVVSAYMLLLSMFRKDYDDIAEKLIKIFLKECKEGD